MVPKYVAMGMALGALVSVPVNGQQRRMAQDSSLNNLRHPAGLATTPFGTLGAVRTVGSGPRTVVLLAGLGFGGGIWDEFMARHARTFTMHAVTLPGFGGTPPLPMPNAPSSYADGAWTQSAVRGVKALVDSLRVPRVTIVAHWALATQVALRLAIDHPDRIEAVVIVGGALKAYYENTPGMMDWSAAQRAAFADGMGRGWFRTVTRETWDDNNFMSYDYAVNPRRGLFLWREAQTPTLSVWIRYLLEFYGTDVSAELPRLRVPVLVVQPGFDDSAFYIEEGRNYMRNLAIDSWRGAADRNSMIEIQSVPASRLFVMFDQPEALDSAIAAFLSRLGSGGARR
jgi:pimeloyl-[acyl-carrier protein] methyl ester esterase